MEPKRKRALVITLVLVTLLGVFLIATYAFPEEPKGGVEARRPGDVTPEAQVVENIATEEADAVKPRFIGEINGFIFAHPEDPTVERRPEKCRATERLPDSGIASAEEIASSPLDFQPQSLPAGFTLVFEEASKCGGEVTSIVRNYSGGEDERVVIGRVAAPPVIVPSVPEDRITATDISGRPAIVLESLFSLDTAADPHQVYTLLYMRDDLGYWIISGTALDREDVLDVAEGVH